MKAKIVIFLSLFFLFSTTIPMEQFNRNKSWIDLVGEVLTGTIGLRTFLSYIHSSQPEEYFDFSGLPKDIKLIIIDLLTRNSYAGTLEVAARTVRALTEVNKELNDLINQSSYCLSLIKRLSERFDCSDEAAAKALSTRAAQERLKLQQPLRFNFRNFDISILTEKKLDDLIQQGIDLDFTYTDVSSVGAMTLLLHCIKNNKFELAKLLIAKGADVNKGDGRGYTPLMYCTAGSVKIDFLKYLLALPQIKIKQEIKPFGTAALESFLIMKGTIARELSTDEEVIEVLKLYLENDRYELTAQEESKLLTMIKQSLSNPEITEMAAKMIEKKRSQ